MRLAPLTRAPRRAARTRVRSAPRLSAFGAPLEWPPRWTSMEAPRPPSEACFPGLGPRRGRLACSLAASLLWLAALGPEAEAQGEPRRRPDQVVWRDRNGAETQQAGLVEENGLARVVVDVGGRRRTLESSAVQGVVFGEVPPSYRDGLAFAARGDFANAAAKFRLAAGDPSARDVVRASARIQAAGALKSLGASDERALAEASAEYEAFLASHPDNREVPSARSSLARLQRLRGEARVAAESYRALYKEAASATVTPGYSAELCFRAGLAAAESYLAAGDTHQARGIYAEMESLIPRVLADVPGEATGLRAVLDEIQAQARLGEGHCLLVGGSTSQARAFFQSQLAGAAPREAALRNGARLGLAEALLAEGQLRLAEIEFATVSAIEPADSDRVARALVGLAECALGLADANARSDARLWLQLVRDHHADTPALRRAEELSREL